MRRVAERCVVAAVARAVAWAVVLGLVAGAPAAARAADWRDGLVARIERIDRESPGELGVWVERLDRGEHVAHAADRPWYLSSAAKVPIAIAVLQEVDAGRLALSDTLRLREEDRIDGVGELTWAPAGGRYAVGSLLDRMLGPSDSTAANMLIRAIGVERLNRSARLAFGGRGIGPLTDFTTVRREIYAELHPDARALSNDALVRLAGVPADERRVEALRRTIGVPPDALRVRTLREAHERFYARGLNAATLDAYGAMLARLVRGELLSPASTRRLFAAMKLGQRGTAHRLEAGLPASWPLIHKTGTQYRRACHVGVVAPADRGAAATVIVACVADLDQGRAADAVLARVGRAIGDALAARDR